MTHTNATTIRRALRVGVAEDAADAARRFAEHADHEGLADVAFTSYDSPIGQGMVAATQRGLVAIALPNRDADDFLAELTQGLSPRVLELPGRLDPIRRELDEYFAGGRHEFDLPLDWRLARPGFYRRVLRATARLPFGVTSTYGEIAARAGNPRAYRAAGTALGHNPIPIVVPCHRVLRAGGQLGEYGGGPEVKEFLLRHEGAIEE